MLFKIFISDIANDMDWKVCLFADEKKEKKKKKICHRVDTRGGKTNDLGKTKGLVKRVTTTV